MLFVFALVFLFGGGRGSRTSDKFWSEYLVDMRWPERSTVGSYEMAGTEEYRRYEMAGTEEYRRYEMAGTEDEVVMRWLEQKSTVGCYEMAGTEEYHRYEMAGTEDEVIMRWLEQKSTVGSYEMAGTEEYRR